MISLPSARQIDRAIGVAGLAAAALNAYFWWRIISSPGDNNPMAIFFALGLRTAPIPIFGLLASFRGRWARLLWRLAACAHLALFLVYELLTFVP